MSKLVLDPNIVHADEVYQTLVDAYEGLDAGEREAFSARLILILANHIGNEQVIRAAIDVARGDDV
ncbi:MAG TPA: hypothetical protein DHW63_10675 [Hyphomonadaceae bacterium]|nr:hypothetical protein [Hyphomonadaceae bacterium]